MEENEALKRLQRGDEAALEWVVDRYAAYVHSIVSGILGSTDVQDVESEVFYTLWCKARSIRKGKLKSYLAGVTRNKAMEALRKSGREVHLEEDVLLLSPENVQKTLEGRERDALVRRAVLQMQPLDREIFLRHYFYCQPVKSIAQQMGFTESTVKTRLHRGRARLKTELQKGGYFVESEDL